MGRVVEYRRRSGKGRRCRLSTERKFLVLTAEFPKRTSVQAVVNDSTTGPGNVAAVPETTFVQTKGWRKMGLSIEIAVGDSLGRGFSLDSVKKFQKEKEYSFDITGKLIHTIEVNDDLSFVGSIGLRLGS
jgi:hypothetical protein